MHSNGGLLIVNADDRGGDSSATDAILTAFEAGGITSTTPRLRSHARLAPGWR